MLLDRDLLLSGCDSRRQKVPVFFPVSREFTGEEFARDCVHRQPVCCFLFSWVHGVEAALLPRIMRQFAILQAGAILSGAEKQAESVEFPPARLRVVAFVNTKAIAGSH
jgi:hypothetical protein